MSYQRPKFKSGNKSFISALNAVLQFAEKHGINAGGRPGWVETEKGWMPPHISPSAISGGAIWTLNIVNAETNEVSINVGTIIADVADITADAEIVDASETFNIMAGDMVWLKVEYDTGTMTVTLQSGDTWAGYPKCYELTGSGASAEWVATRYPLYKFVAASTSETTPIADGLHALKLVADTHLAIIGTNYQAGADKPVTGFTFIPYHRSIP